MNQSLYRITSLLFLSVGLLSAILSTPSTAQTVPVGSLIIPMNDSVSTSNGGQAQILKAYGLVYKLLSQSPPVPVKWAFSLAKTHYGYDFSAASNQVKILGGSNLGAFNYRGGPFIIDAADADRATTIINAFGNSVTVHQVNTAFSSVPIQNTMTQTPKAFVECRKKDNLKLILDVFDKAAIPATAYDTSAYGVPPLLSSGLGGPGGGRNLSSPNCYTIVMIPHEDQMTAQDAQNVVDFAGDGGNAFIECHAIEDFENFSTRKLTTTGIARGGNVTWAYPNAGAQVHLGQFVGTAEAEGGYVPAWGLPTGGAYQSGATSIVQQASNTNYNKVMFIQPTNSGFYCFAGGHSYKDNPKLARILLNAFLSQVTRGACTPLPVELVSFTANIIRKSVRLQWKTATEINNLGFEIERLGKESNWIPIGFVDGYGTVSTPRDYSFIDDNIGNTGSSFSYRLKQIDRDGKVNYSPIVSVNFNAVINRMSFLTAYPNPFNPSTVLSYNLPKASVVTMKIYNSIGVEVATLLEREGQAAGVHSIMFDAASLSSGRYYALLISDNEKAMYEIVLVR